MNTLKKRDLLKNTMCGALLLVFVSACSSGGSNGLESELPNRDATVLEGSLGLQADDPGGSEFTPTVGNTLDISYVDSTVLEKPFDEYIDSQWVHMQSCMEVSAMEPSVSVVEGKITPLSNDDDVVRHIDGQIQASANVTEVSASIQIRAADFDGSLGDQGSYLRSIFGRYLWLSNGFSERSYPFECVRLN